ncbi:Gfo/Idh/MocA family oxidoreductase [bacterium]|nr:Gfo/Idh/MocA family oxidoreductase [bacterium]
MSEPYRVAVIGSSGRGNYGHGMDTVWQNITQAKIVAVADDQPEGLAKAMERLQPEKGFDDYRKMLTEVKPDIVSICPRWIDQRHDMVLMAAAEGVKGIYLEKPLCRTLEEADAMIAACQTNNVKVAVAHQTRYSPILAVIYRMIHEGRIGQLLEIRARGKEDQRGGGEDLWVLGTHVLNLMHYLGGEAQWCFASVNSDGQSADASHIQEGNEGIGPILGDQIQAMYGLDNGVMGYFNSVRNARAEPSRFGIKIYGTKGILAMNTGYLPSAGWLPDASWTPSRTGKRWVQVSSSGPGQPETLHDGGLQAGNLLACQDLIAAMEDNRAPESSIEDARLTTEMIASVYESHRLGKKVYFPLQNRKNPLNDLF